MDVDELLYPAARNSDPITSHEAEAEIDKTKLEAEVMCAFRALGGEAIMDDICKCLPRYRMHTVAPRFHPLLEKGELEDTGKKRKGGSKRSQRVLAVVPKERMAEARASFMLAELNRIERRIQSALSKKRTYEHLLGMYYGEETIDGMD